MARIIRSHKERVRQANDTLKNNSRYNIERISIFDREAFVEFYLLEDIERLYRMRLANEEAYVPQGRADERGRVANIERFKAIINLFQAAIGACRAAISAGLYKAVWKAIPERALMVAANSVKRLPVLREIVGDILRDLYKDKTFVELVLKGVNDDLDDYDINDKNTREYYQLPTQDEIDEVIRSAEEVIPDKKRNNKVTPNT